MKIKKILTGLILCTGLIAPAQEIHVTNAVTETKERVLRIESTIPASPAEVWKAFATEDGLRKWIAPVVALDLRNGGTLSTHYDKTAAIGSPGTIRLEIVHYLEGELMTYRIHLTSSFDPKVRAEDQNLQEIIQIMPETNGRTKVVSSMVGWGTGAEWDKVYSFFAKGNAWTYGQLIKSFSESPK